MIVNRLFRQQFRNISYSFATQKLDYYAVLGVDRLATTEQIKDSYRKLAMKYHPDVNTTATEAHEPSARKFQEIAEAYAVLSVEEQRRAYDFLNQPSPYDRYTEDSALEDELLRRRSVDGNAIRQPHKVGTYAAEKQRLLAEERAKFNVDHLGRYKGGLPIKGNGVIRKGIHGEGFGAPSHAHDALIHQIKESKDTMDYQNITNEVAQNFANHQNNDRWVVERRKSNFIAQVDYEYFKFNHWRTAWRYFRNIFLLTAGVSFLYNFEVDEGLGGLSLKYKEFAQTNPGKDLVLGKIRVTQRPNGLLVAVDAHQKQHHHD
ncbi:hypothetical protein ABPG72_003819 [Tetrahymena utriculariae]